MTHSAPAANADLSDVRGDGGESFPSERPTHVAWGYAIGSDEQASALYRRGRIGTWTSDDHDIDTRAEHLVVVDRDRTKVDDRGVFATFDDHNWAEWDDQTARYTLSQALHGEQMGMLAAAALVEACPQPDFKMFAATQAADEARHLEVLERYLRPWGGPYPVHPELRQLLLDVLSTKQWDLMYIATQVMIEGLGMGVLSRFHHQSADIRLRNVCKDIMRDEARHIAFGAHAVRVTMDELTHNEQAERLAFVDHAIRALLDSVIQASVAERFGIDQKAFRRASYMSPQFHATARELFSHIVSLCANMGLLAMHDRWLEERFRTLGLTR